MTDHSPNTTLTLNPFERKVTLSLVQFRDAITASSGNLSPSLLCEQLYQLAQTSNIFYEQCRVDNSSKESYRLLLCQGVVNTMSCGMKLLGIARMEDM